MVSHCDTVSRQDMMFSCFDMRRTLFYRTRLSRLVTSFSFLFQKPTRESHLGAGGPDLLVLTQHPGALLMPGTTGLHHFAILVPSRLALALVLRHLGKTRTPLQESYNHWCSESIYVVDPDGNGIEIYRDCPRSEWLFDGALLRIDSVSLDLEGLLSELSERNDVWSGLPPETAIGHVNLRVANLAE